MAIDVGIVLIDDASNETSICTSRFDFPGLIPKKRAVVIASMAKISRSREKNRNQIVKIPPAPFYGFVRAKRVFGTSWNHKI